MNDMLRSKTVWTGLAGLLAAAAGYYTGEMNLGDTVQTGLTGLLGIFLRAGIAKG